MPKFQDLYLVPRSEPETKGNDNPVSTGDSGKRPPTFFSGATSTESFPLSSEPRGKVWVKRAENYRHCSTCHRRKTGWLVSYDDGEDRRVCAHCMTPTERRLVETIVALNTGKKLPKGVREGATT